MTIKTFKIFDKNLQSLQHLYYDVCSLEENIKKAEKELLNKITKKTWIDEMTEEIENK